MKAVEIWGSFRLNLLFKYGNIALSVASAILLVPFYLRHLSAAEYGGWLAVGALATWFSVMDPGVANLLIQRVAHSWAQGDRGSVAGYIFSGLLISTVVALGVVLLGYWAAPSLVGWMNLQGIDEQALVSAFRLALVSTGVMIVVFGVVGALQGAHASGSAGFSLLFAALLRIVFAIILLEWGVGLLAIPWAGLVAACGALFLAVSLLFVTMRESAVPFVVSKTRVREFCGLFALSFGARVGKIFTGTLDNVLIARFLGPEHVAAYALTATVPRQAENLIAQPFAALRPTLTHLFFTKSDKEATGTAVLRALRGIWWGGGLVFAGLLGLNDDFVRLWVGSGNFAGEHVALALAVLFMVRVFTNATGAMGFSLGDIRKNSIIEWTYSLSLIPAVLLGVTFGGVLGIVLAHIAIQLFTMAWYFPRSVWSRLEWGASEAWAIGKEILACALGVLMAVFACPSPNDWPSFAGSAVVVAGVYATVLTCVSSEFRREIRVWGRNARSR